MTKMKTILRKRSVITSALKKNMTSSIRLRANKKHIYKPSRIKEALIALIRVV